MLGFTPIADVAIAVEPSTPSGWETGVVQITTDIQTVVKMVGY